MAAVVPDSRLKDTKTLFPEGRSGRESESSKPGIRSDLVINNCCVQKCFLWVSEWLHHQFFTLFIGRCTLWKHDHDVVRNQSLASGAALSFTDNSFTHVHKWREMWCLWLYGCFCWFFSRFNVTGYHHLQEIAFILMWILSQLIFFVSMDRAGHRNTAAYQNMPRLSVPPFDTQRLIMWLWSDNATCDWL